MKDHRSLGFDFLDSVAVQAGGLRSLSKARTKRFSPAAFRHKVSSEARNIVIDTNRVHETSSIDNKTNFPTEPYTQKLIPVPSEVRLYSGVPNFLNAIYNEPEAASLLIQTAMKSPYVTFKIDSDGIGYLFAKPPTGISPEDCFFQDVHVDSDAGKYLAEEGYEILCKHCKGNYRMEDGMDVRPLLLQLGFADAMINVGVLNDGYHLTLAQDQGSLRFDGKTGRSVRRQFVVGSGEDNRIIAQNVFGSLGAKETGIEAPDLVSLFSNRAETSYRLSAYQRTPGH